MNPQLLAAVTSQVIVPELLALIRAHHAATGEIMTDEEAIAKLNLDADTAIAKGEAFLKQ